MNTWDIDRQCFPLHTTKTKFKPSCIRKKRDDWIYGYKATSCNHQQLHELNSNKLSCCGSLRTKAHRCAWIMMFLLQFTFLPLLPCLSAKLTFTVGTTMLSTRIFKTSKFSNNLHPFQNFSSELLSVVITREAGGGCGCWNWIVI